MPLETPFTYVVRILVVPVFTMAIDGSLLLHTPVAKVFESFVESFTLQSAPLPVMAGSAVKTGTVYSANA